MAKTELFRQEHSGFISATFPSLCLCRGCWNRSGWWYNESLNKTHTHNTHLCINSAAWCGATLSNYGNGTLHCTSLYVSVRVCITPHCVPCGQINSLPDSFPVNLLKQKVSVLISSVQCLASSIYLYSVSLSLSLWLSLSLLLHSSSCSLV